MKKRTSSLPILVLVAVVALVLGSFGTATAAGLTAGKVKKIATKVVTKKAPTLSVASAANAGNAAALNGQPASAYQDISTVYWITKTVTSGSSTITIPLAAGNYNVGYSAYLSAWLRIQRVLHLQGVRASRRRCSPPTTRAARRAAPHTPRSGTSPSPLVRPSSSTASRPPRG